MKEYGVTIPIAGHSFVIVQAESEEEAIEIAREKADEGEVTWESLTQFSKGNVCYCPNPWHIEVEDNGDIDED